MIGGKCMEPEKLQLNDLPDFFTPEMLSAVFLILQKKKSEKKKKKYFP